METDGGGGVLLECVRRARDEVIRKQAKTRSDLQLIGKQFGLDPSAAAAQAALKFASDWENKATTETGELGEWIEYLNYFREAGGGFLIGSEPREEAGRPMARRGAPRRAVFQGF